MSPMTRAEFLVTTGNHPYAALMTGPQVTVFRRGAAYVWLSEGPWGPVTASLGDAADVLPLLAELHAAGALADSRWLHLPRTPSETIARHVTTTYHDDWDFLWTVDAPPAVAHEDRVVELSPDDGPAIEAVLDDALPDSTTRPGDPRIQTWFGVRAGDRLVAVAADRSRGGTGFLAGIAVSRDHQGQGLGAAVTAAVTRRLFHGYAVVALGVMSDNIGAQHLYERLGFRQRIERTSILLAASL